MYENDVNICSPMWSCSAMWVTMIAPTDTQHGNA
jgi:hypothetical protein